MQCVGYGFFFSHTFIFFFLTYLSPGSGRSGAIAEFMPTALASISQASSIILNLSLAGTRYVALYTLIAYIEGQATFSL